VGKRKHSINFTNPPSLKSGASKKAFQESRNRGKRHSGREGQKHAKKKNRVPDTGVEMEEKTSGPIGNGDRKPSRTRGCAFHQGEGGGLNQDGKGSEQTIKIGGGERG